MTAAHHRHRPQHLLAEQAFSRAAGAPLIGGNTVDLLIDAPANYAAWLAAIAEARETILFANYIFRDDDVGRAFVTALAARARAGVRVYVTRDWLGCLGQSSPRLWRPLLDAGGEVRAYNPPSLLSPFGWLSRDHRKLLVVDRSVGFVGGLCVSAAWLGDPARQVPAWRDTAVAIRGPAVEQLAHAFAEVWAQMGPPLPDATWQVAAPSAVGHADLRVVATVPNVAGLYRFDQLIAGLARHNLWLADAYFVGVTPYVQALVAAARDGVDVRLLVPGSSDIPLVGSMSRAGYRVLLEAGVRVFEWNGSMMHAKTAVADSRWARVGSTNLNIASWMGNCEIDVAIEDAEFARQMQVQYERDLANATEIVLATARPRRERPRKDMPLSGPHGGSSGRAAASALRIAHSVGAAITNRRLLGAAEAAPLLLGALLLLLLSMAALLWPFILAWPLGVLGTWIAVTLLVRYGKLRRRH